MSPGSKSHTRVKVSASGTESCTSGNVLAQQYFPAPSIPPQPPLKSHFCEEGPSDKAWDLARGEGLPKIGRQLAQNSTSHCNFTSHPIPGLSRGSPDPPERILGILWEDGSEKVPLPHEKSAQAKIGCSPLFQKTATPLKATNFLFCKRLPILYCCSQSRLPRYSRHQWLNEYLQWTSSKIKTTEQETANIKSEVHECQASKCEPWDHT